MKKIFIKVSKFQEAKLRKKGGTWQVIDDEGKVLGEHDTKEEALDQLRAIYTSCGSKKSKKKKEDIENKKPKKIIFFDSKL
ncbi:MAG TPA: hypothetical protein PLI42_01775 [Candidatus Pacearchaeota archaeon]|nr:hypothetical protein [Candidatus Pacearchaeota archaeon]